MSGTCNVPRQTGHHAAGTQLTVACESSGGDRGVLILDRDTANIDQVRSAAGWALASNYEIGECVLKHGAIEGGDNALSVSANGTTLLYGLGPASVRKLLLSLPEQVLTVITDAYPTSCFGDTLFYWTLLATEESQRPSGQELLECSKLE